VTKTAIPTNPTELEEMLDDRVAVEKHLAEGTFSNLVQAYVKAVSEKDTGIKKQVEEQVQQVLAQYFRDNPEQAKTSRLDFSPPKNGPTRIGFKPNPNAVGAPLDGIFGSSGEFFATAWHATHRHGTPTKEQDAQIAKVLAYQEKVPAEGGFLVPEEFRSEIMALALEDAIVRPRAQVIPMSSLTLRFPAVDDTSHATSLFGGVVVYRTEEGAELTESAASFAAIKLEATKQTALAHVTNELIRDAPAFQAFVEGSFPAAIAYFEDVDFISGNGAGQPLGGLNAANTALVTVSKVSGQAATTIEWRNVIAMYARMLPTSINRAVWLASPDTFAELATMALQVGTGGSAVWIMDAHGAPQLTLLGRPIIMTEKAPGALGTIGDLSFVDWGMYLIGDRQSMVMDSSPHVKFTSDKTTFRVIARNDGRPWLTSPITPRNGSATLSPFINLETR
jgi:HK97 family phage major capsid protein